VNTALAAPCARLSALTWWHQSSFRALDQWFHPRNDRGTRAKFAAPVRGQPEKGHWRDKVHQMRLEVFIFGVCL
jgi:hypothetical protein